MTDGLLPFDRRMEIMYMLSAKRRITRRELALEFSVSDDVIDRDLVILNRYLPLEIIRGRYGGVKLSEEYKGTRIYLNRNEEVVLNKCFKYLNGQDKQTLKSIIHKFVMPK